jgi:hypothetical protein
MRSFALAVVGLAAVSNALPTVQDRQAFVFGDPSVVFTPDTPIKAPKKGYPDIPFPFPVPEHKDPKFTIGKRDVGLSRVDVVASSFESLAHHYGSKPAPPLTFELLEKMAELLRQSGHSTEDIIFLGPGKTHFQISGRQHIGCSNEDRVALLIAFAILQASQSDPKIEALKQAVIAALQACNAGVQPGPIVPGPTVPGGPLVPEPTIPGAPIVPDKPVQGAPLVPDKPATGAPMVPSS